MKERKKRDRNVHSRFNGDDVQIWQEAANSSTGGNLTLFMENAANKLANEISKSIVLSKDKPK